jgi:heme-degrading monooxygenase HmoA
MVAAMATITGPAAGLAEMSRLASESVDDWLRGYEGYRGLVVLTDEAGGRSQVTTFWETAEAEEKARAARGAMRDQIAETVGMAVADFGVYEVAVFEIPGDENER